MLGDGGYGIRDYPKRFKETFGESPILKIFSKPPEQKGFEVIPTRWVTERTNAWNLNARRLAKDHETTMESAEGFVALAGSPQQGFSSVGLHSIPLVRVSWRNRSPCHIIRGARPHDTDVAGTMIEARPRTVVATCWHRLAQIHLSSG